MTTNWLGGPTTPSDPSTFNYDTATQQLQRQRAAAAALQQIGMGTNQGQLIKGGDFTGFAGGNTVGSTLARVLASALSTKANDNADAQQSQLSQDSQDALAYAMNPANTPAGKRAAAAALLAQNNTVQAGDRVDPNATPNNPDAKVETYPVDAPSTSVNPMAQAAAQALVARPNPAPGAPQPAPQPMPSAPANPGAIPALAQGQTVSSTPRPMQSVTGGPQSFGMGGLSRVLGPQVSAPPSAPAASGSMSPSDIAFASKMFSQAPQATKSPVPTAQASVPGARGSMSPSDMAFAAKMFGGAAQPAPVPAANAPTASPAVTGATGQMPAAPMSPPMPAQGQAPMPQPQAPMPAPVQQAPMPQPQQAQAPMPAQAAPAPDPSQPTQAEQIAQLQAIARTGPMGQQMALAQMNNMFASKIGRYKTSVMADPVNGGFLKTTEDSVTGASKSEAIGGGNGTLVTGQTTDANGNRLNVHKDGSTTPMLDGSGKPVVDSSVVARNDDQTTKVGAAVQSNANAQAAIDTALARNNRILELYKSTETGPFMGTLPNVTAGRQELQALLAQDLFGETRNALAGAGDAGGAPKMAQSEFRYMQDNGGLKQTTKPEAAANLIANMNAQLMKQKSALQDFRSTLQTTAPGAASGVPARGQTVSASQWGFK